MSILILDYRQWQTDRFHCTFHVSEDRSHERFSDAIEIHTVELPKLPPLAERSEGGASEWPLVEWGQFLAARSEKDLELLAKENPVIAKAKTALDTLSSDPAVLDLVESRLRAAVAYKLEMAAQKAEGLREGEAKGLRLAVEATCRLMGIEWTPAREAEVSSLALTELQELLTSLTTCRRWPSR
ncbi:MAG: PD-(D/E)XK nuclease family transposase [Deltaproteobacteria bacterium]|nr:PD-(D/E)XK nuclease family transposase [Deltaproteobacteria bacterium]